MTVVRYLVNRAPGLSLSVKRMGGVRSGRGHIMFLSLLAAALSVCLSVCLSQAGVESKRRDGLSWDLTLTIILLLYLLLTVTLRPPSGYRTPSWKGIRDFGSLQNRRIFLDAGYCYIRRSVALIWSPQKKLIKRAALVTDSKETAVHYFS